MKVEVIEKENIIMDWEGHVEGIVNCFDPLDREYVVLLDPKSDTPYHSRDVSDLQDQYGEGHFVPMDDYRVILK